MLDANPWSITDLFEGKKRYLVPLFQRPYVWSRADHWEPLWEDIRSQAEASLARADVAKHFLGAVILSEERSNLGGLKRYRIIDGQQRLTTLQLFIAAVRDLSKAASADLFDDLRHLTENTGRMADEKRERFKLWPTRGDVEAFTTVLRAGSPPAVLAAFPPPKGKGRKAPEETRPALVLAYLFFAQAVETWANEAGADAPARLTAIADALSNRLEVVAIELDAAQDPQVIFESLNGRNEPLGPSDLLRNYLFRRVEEQSGGELNDDSRSQELYDRYWAPFDLPDDPKDPASPRFWQQRQRQGRLDRARMDVFIQHFLAMQCGRDVNVGRLFQEYRAFAQPVGGEPPFGSVEQEFAHLAAAAKLYRKLLEPELDTRLGQCAARLRTLDITTAYPLLLALLHKPLSAEQLDRYASEIESYFVRRLVCGIESQGSNRLFATLARDALRATELPPNWLAKRLQDHQDSALKSPGDTEFRKAWLEEPLYKRMNAARVEMILRALNRAHANAYNGGLLPAPGTRLTIEHVLPQKWYDKWPLSSALSAEALDEATERRDRLKHSIGNLTLITQGLNTSLSNEPYPAKRSMLAVHAGLWLNGWFQTHESWDEAAIEERGNALFELARQVWPEMRA